MTPPKPRGRDEIRAAAIAATHRILRSSGPVKLTMRAVAAEANVNVGLLHRHFGSRADLLRAAADEMRALSAGRISDAVGLQDAVSVMLAAGEPAFGHGIAWSILQDEMDAVLPETFPAVDALVRLAKADGHSDRVDRLALVAALLSMSLGWRLYEPYLTRCLQLSEKDRRKVEAGLGRLLADLAEPPAGAR